VPASKKNHLPTSIRHLQGEAISHGGGYLSEASPMRGDKVGSSMEGSSSYPEGSRCQEAGRQELTPD